MKAARWLAVFAFLPLAAWAQQTAQPFLEISGDIPHPRTFQEQEWKELKHVSISATNAHDKKTATYTGVPLRDLLMEAGLPSGEKLRGKALTTVILVSASDGYQVVFSIAELDEGIGNTQVVIADSEDGKPLAQTMGPLRLIVPTDKHPTRLLQDRERLKFLNSHSARSVCVVVRVASLFKQWCGPFVLSHRGRANARRKCSFAQ